MLEKQKKDPERSSKELEKCSAIQQVDSLQHFQQFAFRMREAAELLQSIDNFKLQSGNDDKHLEPSATAHSGLHQVLSAALACTGDASTALLTTLLALESLPDWVVVISVLRDSEAAGTKQDNVRGTVNRCNEAVQKMLDSFQKVNATIVELSDCFPRECTLCAEKMTCLWEGFADETFKAKFKKDDLKALKGYLNKEKKSRGNKEALDGKPLESSLVQDCISSLKKQGSKISQHLKLNEKKKKKNKLESGCQIGGEKEDEKVEENEEENKLAMLQEYITKAEQKEKITDALQLLDIAKKSISATMEVWKTTLDLAKTKCACYFITNNNETSGSIPAAEDFVRMSLQLSSISRIYRDHVENHVQPLLFEAQRILAGPKGDFHRDEKIAEKEDELSHEAIKEILAEKEKEVKALKKKMHNLSSRLEETHGMDPSAVNMPEEPKKEDSSKLKYFLLICPPLLIMLWIFRSLLPKTPR